MEVIELNEEDREVMEEVIRLEEEAFGKAGGVDLWILKPLVKYGKVLVLKDQGEVKGVAEYIRSFNGNECYLYGFAIKKEFRGMGLGFFLLEKTVDLLRKEKIKKIVLTVAPENEKGLSLYKKQGFKKEKLLKNEYGVGIDRLYLTKEI